ncbi:hypothetical protein CLU79DRAFT_744578 [Phycomyces nitens]|nr:hypothetical protein CLU79DRAFT_744578 [Phycomyces nitens]
MRARSSSTSAAGGSQSSFSARRLSQHITGIVTGPWTRNSQSSASLEVPNQFVPESTPEPPTTTLTVTLDGDTRPVLRPNHIYRGNVKVENIYAIYASQIRIELRAEEIATVKTRETNESLKLDRIDQTKTTYFDISFKVFGDEPNAYSAGSWQKIEPGEHIYPFAIKMSNTNFPPSTEFPVGFAVRYIWTARLIGPGLGPEIVSKELKSVFRPTLCAPLPEVWEYYETLYREKKSLANVIVCFPRHVFCPEEDVEGYVDIKAIPSNAVVSELSFVLTKTVEGKKACQLGTVRRMETQDILSENVPVHGNDGSVRLPLHFKLPDRLVSPCFQSKHIRTHYSLVVTVRIELLKTLLKSSSIQTSSFTMPISIGNLSHDNILAIPDLTSLQDYRQSTDCPLFFDPELDNPPSATSMWGPMTTLRATPPVASPPNYFSLPQQTPQAGGTRQSDVVIETSRFVKQGDVPSLGEPMYIDATDEGEW